MTPDKHELEYLAQAHWHHFRFRLGNMDGLDRIKKEVSVAPFYDEDGEEIIQRRVFKYDTLIIAVGSTTNDFGIAGAREHTIALDTQAQARSEEHTSELQSLMRISYAVFCLTKKTHTITTGEV